MTFRLWNVPSSMLALLPNFLECMICCFCNFCWQAVVTAVMFNTLRTCIGHWMTLPWLTSNFMSSMRICHSKRPWIPSAWGVPHFGLLCLLLTAVLVRTESFFFQPNSASINRSYWALWMWWRWTFCKCWWLSMNSYIRCFELKCCKNWLNSRAEPNVLSWLRYTT